MKRKLLYLIPVFLICFFIGCGVNNTKTNDKSQDSKINSKSEKTYTQISDEIKKQLGEDKLNFVKCSVDKDDDNDKDQLEVEISFKDGVKDLTNDNVIKDILEKVEKVCVPNYKEIELKIYQGNIEKAKYEYENQKWSVDK